MKALWLENLQVSLRELPDLKPAEGEALLEIELAGVCSTDLEMLRGYYPFTGVPGHEFVGNVAAAPGNASWVGKRVVGEINITCGSCRACLNGIKTHCENRTVLGISGRDGVFAERALLPVANLHEIPQGLPSEAAVFTEPLAAALEILEQVHIRPRERVFLAGAGRLGQLIARVLAATGCELLVAARHAEQRCLLEQAGIACVDEEAVPRRWADIAVEATGSPSGFAMARQALRPRGILVLKSTYAGDLSLNMSSLVVDEITLVGSRCGPFEPALRCLAEGRLDPTVLISGRYPLERGVEALAQAGKPGIFKILIQP